jgi:hypothetical protein
MQYMIRTQVTLPEELLRDIKLQAKREQKDENYIIQELLRVGLTNKRRQAKESTGASLLRLAEIEGTGPSDLSTLLGKKSGKEAAKKAWVRLMSEESQFLLIDTAAYVYDAFEKFDTLPPAVSFIDCVVMAVADAYRTKDIFGFDKQFADAGYTRLIPSTDWTEAA